MKGNVSFVILRGGGGGEVKGGREPDNATARARSEELRLRVYARVYQLRALMLGVSRERERERGRRRKEICFNLCSYDGEDAYVHT